MTTTHVLTEDAIINRRDLKLFCLAMTLPAKKGLLLREAACMTSLCKKKLRFVRPKAHIFKCFNGSNSVYVKDEIARSIITQIFLSYLKSNQLPKKIRLGTHRNQHL